MRLTRLDHILFLDIETVPLKAHYSQLDDRSRRLFEKKAVQLKSKEADFHEIYKNRAGIWAEFGKVVCICVGHFTDKLGSDFRTKTFNHSEEEILLEEFKLFLDRSFNREWHLLCAHNGKEFDFPYIARRMIIRGIPLPGILDIMGKKPWQIKHLDTMELWKFGDFKHYTSLDLLCHLFQLPGPKSDLDGSQVAEVYYRDKDLERIVKYCRQDVLSLVRVFLRQSGLKELSAKVVLPEI